MSETADSEFRVCPEVADLYDISFILCGMFSCESCGASPPEDPAVKPCSDLAYYRTAELAYGQGWQATGRNEHAVLCPACIAQQRHAADARNARA
jgi:hypothetical protein